MKKVILLPGLLVLLVLLVPLAAANNVSADSVVVKQHSGGSSYDFYYGCFASQCGANNDDRHMFAIQTFKVDFFKKITKVELKLKAITSSIWNPCNDPYSQNNFDVEIRDAYDDTLAYKDNLKICDLPQNAFGWKEIRFNNPISVNKGDTYKVVVLYRGVALKNSPNMAWERSTRDVYRQGGSFTNDGNSNNDFVFRVYGLKK